MFGQPNKNHKTHKIAALPSRAVLFLSYILFIYEKELGVKCALPQSKGR